MIVPVPEGIIAWSDSQQGGYFAGFAVQDRVPVVHDDLAVLGSPSALLLADGGK